MSKIDWRKFKPQIAAKTLPAMRKQYPECQLTDIEEAIEAYHASLSPKNTLQNDIFKALYVIETAMSKGWMK